MPQFAVENFDPLDSATPVYDVTDGQAKQIGFSTRWNAINNTNHPGQGSEQWMNQIIVAKDSVTAKESKVELPEKPDPNASSSASSRRVEALFLSPDGKSIEKTQVIPYVLVPISHRARDPQTGKVIVDSQGKPKSPIADEIWFSFQKPVGLIHEVMNRLEIKSQANPQLTAASALTSRSEVSES